MEKCDTVRVERKYFSSILILTFAILLFTGTAVFGQNGDGDFIDYEPLIVGGDDGDIEDLPWQVGLINQNGFNYCGATIIDEEWILTAAHCVFEDGQDLPLPLVRSGVTNIYDDSGQNIQVVEQIVHPHYNETTLENDIALLRLQNPLDLTVAGSKAVSLITPALSDAGLDAPEIMATVSGWGTLESDGDTPEILQVAQVPIVSNEDANAPDRYDGGITENMLAAGYLDVGGIDACQGDSGGPLVVPNPNDPVGFSIAGVVSFGIGCADADYPGIYARVSKYIDWIDIQLERGEVIEPLSRDVVFSVNMSARISQNEFVVGEDEVKLAGDFTEWQDDPFPMTDDNGDHIYELTVNFTDDEGEIKLYKFIIDDGETITWEDGDEREVTLGPFNETQVLETPFFNNDESFGDPVDRNVTFTVDMSHVTYFESDLDELYIMGPFNEWSAMPDYELTETDVDGMYSVTATIAMANLETTEFKYYISAGDDREIPDDGWEIFDGDRSFQAGEEIDIVLPEHEFNRFVTIADFALWEPASETVFDLEPDIDNPLEFSWEEAENADSYLFILYISHAVEMENDNENKTAIMGELSEAEEETKAEAETEIELELEFEVETNSIGLPESYLFDLFEDSGFELGDTWVGAWTAVAIADRTTKPAVESHEISFTHAEKLPVDNVVFTFSANDGYTTGSIVDQNEWDGVSFLDGEFSAANLDAMIIDDSQAFVDGQSLQIVGDAEVAQNTVFSALSPKFNLTQSNEYEFQFNFRISALEGSDNAARLYDDISDKVVAEFYFEYDGTVKILQDNFEDGHEIAGEWTASDDWQTASLVYVPDGDITYSLNGTEIAEATAPSDIAGIRRIVVYGDNFHDEETVHFDNFILNADVTEVETEIEPHTITGNSGWRLLSLPASDVPVHELAAQNQMQGFAGLNDFYDDGADYESSEPNFYFRNDDEWVLPGDFGLETEIPSGTGFIWYMFDNDDGASISLPFDLTLESTITPANDIEIDLQTNADFQVIGNPFNFTIATSHILGGLQEGFYFVDEAQQTFELETEVENIDRFQAVIGQVSDGNEPGDKIQIAPEPFILEVRENQIQIMAALRVDTETEDGQAFYNNAYLRFHPEASMGWDRHDISKLSPLTDTFVSLAFIGERNGNTVFKAQDSYPDSFSGSLDIPVAFDASNVSGEFTISADVDRLPEDWSLVLTDHQNDVSVILNDENYSFLSEATAEQKRATQPTTIQSFDSLDESGRFSLSVHTGDVTSTELGSEIPKDVMLSQNYPNPFNPVTTIHFGLPESQNVTLEVYNMLGQRVATLADGEMAAGFHDIRFDASQLASGVYIYRLDAGTNVLTNKMILVK